MHIFRFPFPRERLRRPLFWAAPTDDHTGGGGGQRGETGVTGFLQGGRHPGGGT